MFYFEHWWTLLVKTTKFRPQIMMKVMIVIKLYAFHWKWEFHCHDHHSFDNFGLLVMMIYNNILWSPNSLLCVRSKHELSEWYFSLQAEQFVWFQKLIFIITLLSPRFLFVLVSQIGDRTWWCRQRLVYTFPHLSLPLLVSPSPSKDYFEIEIQNNFG